MTSIAFRVDASVTMGTGHLMRCLALAQHAVQAGIKPIFFVSPETEPLCRKRHDWVGDIVTVPSESQPAQELALIAQVTSTSGCKALVVDGYHFSADYRAKLKRNTQCLVVFDDNNDLGALHADVVINGADNAQQLDYAATAPAATLCTGAGFRVLRPEFSSGQSLPWQERKQLTLMMGGSDPCNVLLPLLKQLSQLKASMPITVLSGAAYQHRQILADWCARSALNVHHIHACEAVAQEFGRSRLVVSAAGSTQYELVACATPALLCVVADNQLNATQQACLQGWCEWQDVRNDDQLVSLAQHCLDLWHDDKRLAAYHQVAEGLAQHDGAQKVLAAIQRRSLA